MANPVLLVPRGGGYSTNNNPAAGGGATAFGVAIGATEPIRCHNASYSVFDPTGTAATGYVRFAIVLGQYTSDMSLFTCTSDLRQQGYIVKYDEIVSYAVALTNRINMFAESPLESDRGEGLSFLLGLTGTPAGATPVLRINFSSEIRKKIRRPRLRMAESRTQEADTV